MFVGESKAKRGRARHSKVASLASVVAVLLTSLAVAPAAADAPAKKPKPGKAVSVVSISPTTSRIGDQPVNPVTVVVRGVDSKTTVEVSFEVLPEGGTQKKKGKCSVAKARKSPDKCRVTLSHSYTQVGQQALSGWAGKERIFQVIEITEDRWTPPAGQVFNGWRTYRDSYGANFSPCRQITWFFDRSNEKADRNTMIDDVRAGLATLEPLTGLTFVETDDPNSAALTFNWGDISEYGENFAGYASTDGVNKGWVIFSDTADWTKNVWAGSGNIRLDDYPSPGFWRSKDGRQTLVIHEVMHTLGFEHVDVPDSIMHPTNMNGTTFNQGDLEGLATMYLNNPCPGTLPVG